MKSELHCVDLDLSKAFEVVLDHLYLFLGLILAQLMILFWDLKEVYFKY